MQKLKTIDDLKPCPENPRQITKEAQVGLKNSVDEFGDLSGITWNRRFGELVCGHQRIEVLKQLGAQFYVDEVQGAWFDLEGERFDVRVVDWPKTKHYAAMVAANNEQISGDWTMDVADLVKKVGDENQELFGNLRFDSLLSMSNFTIPDINQQIVEPKPEEKNACPSCGFKW